MTPTVPSASILGEALHAGFGRLAILLQQELNQPPSSVGDTLAETLGFAGWEELCDRAIRTTSRDVDPRLNLLLRGDLDDDLAERLAVGFGATSDTMRALLRDWREPAAVG